MRRRQHLEERDPLRRARRPVHPGRRALGRPPPRAAGDCGPPAARAGRQSRRTAQRVRPSRPAVRPLRHHHRLATPGPAPSRHVLVPDLPAQVTNAPIRSGEARGTVARMPMWPGEAYPLGATYDGTGTNFALFSEVAERVELCLYDEKNRETARIELP